MVASNFSLVDANDVKRSTAHVVFLHQISNSTSQITVQFFFHSKLMQFECSAWNLITFFSQTFFENIFYSLRCWKWIIISFWHFYFSFNRRSAQWQQQHSWEDNWKFVTKWKIQLMWLKSESMSINMWGRHFRQSRDLGVMLSSSYRRTKNKWQRMFDKLAI